MDLKGLVTVLPVALGELFFNILFIKTHDIITKGFRKGFKIILRRRVVRVWGGLHGTRRPLPES